MSYTHKDLHAWATQFRDLAKDWPEAASGGELEGLCVRGGTYLYSAWRRGFFEPAVWADLDAWLGEPEEGLEDEFYCRSVEFLWWGADRGRWTAGAAWPHDPHDVPRSADITRLMCPQAPPTDPSPPASAEVLRYGCVVWATIFEHEAAEATRGTFAEKVAQILRDQADAMEAWYHGERESVLVRARAADERGDGEAAKQLREKVVDTERSFAPGLAKDPDTVTALSWLRRHEPHIYNSVSGPQHGLDGLDEVAAAWRRFADLIAGPGAGRESAEGVAAQVQTIRRDLQAIQPWSSAAAAGDNADSKPARPAASPEVGRIAKLYRQATTADLALATDLKVWEHLKETHDASELPPSLDAFRKLVSRARTAGLLERKRAPRTSNRATGKSVIRRTDT